MTNFIPLNLFFDLCKEVLKKYQSNAINQCFKVSFWFEKFDSKQIIIALKIEPFTKKKVSLKLFFWRGKKED